MRLPQLMRVIESLGVLLACVRDAVAPQGCTLELLRQESFAGGLGVCAGALVCVGA